MDASRTASIAAPIAALVLAAVAGASLAVAAAVGIRSDAAESLATGLTIFGWVMLVWSAIIGAAYAVHLARRASSRRDVSRAQVMLGASTLAVVALVVAVFPLWGSGSGTAG